MTENNYSQEVMKHFLKPKNIGDIKKADGIGKVGNPICGDVMQIYIKVGKNPKGEKIIKDIKFQTFGCAAAIATSSMLTEIAKGKKLADAKKITREDISKSLKGLPPLKMHCSNLASDALKEAIKNYETKSKKS
jgi:nitrogen fixation protein NifU and related proteins